VHGNAPMTPRGRMIMIERIAAGRPVVWVPKTRPGPLTCGFAGAAGGCDGSPELRDPREWPCPSVARLIARESAARAQRSNCFALIAGLAVRSYWSCASAFGRTAGTATDPITARETPAQHARTSFRHPQDPG
jgi:hypothetical protein